MSVYDLLHESADKAVYKCMKFGLPLNTQLRLLKSQAAWIINYLCQPDRHKTNLFRLRLFI